MEWVDAPADDLDLLWEGELELAAENDGTRSVADEALRDAALGLPVVSIGKPRLVRKLNSASGDQYCIVQFACSFRPVYEQSRIEWARFVVEFLSDGNGKNVSIADLHPLLVTIEHKREVKVVLRPSLKFAEVEGELGEGVLGWTYPELRPTITANGLNESVASWDFETDRGSFIQGSKHMYSLLKVPLDVRRVQARLDLVADLRVKGKGPFAVAIPWAKRTAIDEVPIVTIV